VTLLFKKKKSTPCFLQNLPASPEIQLSLVLECSQSSWCWRGSLFCPFFWSPYDGRSVADGTSGGSTHISHSLLTVLSIGPYWSRGQDSSVNFWFLTQGCSTPFLLQVNSFHSLLKWV